MSQKFINNYESRLLTYLGAESTSISLVDELPQLGRDDWYVLTIYTRASSEIEVVKLSYLHTGERIVLRGQEGTEPRAWSALTPVEMRVTAGAFDSLNAYIKKNKITRFLDL